MERNIWNSVRIGEEIGFIDGPGQSLSDCVGTVTQKVEDRWGLHVVVGFPRVLGEPDRLPETVHGFTTVGIGAYRMAERKNPDIYRHGPKTA